MVECRLRVSCCHRVVCSWCSPRVADAAGHHRLLLTTESYKPSFSATEVSWRAQEWLRKEAR